MRLRTLIASGIVIILLAAVTVFAYVMTSTSAYLRAEVHEEKADFGIPGVTKTYEAVLTHAGHRPALVSRCDFVDDANSPGTEIAYSVQRWDPDDKSWHNVVSASPTRFCKPYPLGIIRATLHRRLLWPGANLSAGEEATAAREPFQKGDRARFVIFTNTAGDMAHSLPTPEFLIDEHSTSDVSFRVRH